MINKIKGLFQTTIRKVKLKDLNKRFNSSPQKYSKAVEYVRQVWEDPTNKKAEQDLYEFCCKAFQDPRKMKPERMAWIFPTWYNKRSIKNQDKRFKKRAKNYLKVVKSLKEHGYRPEIFKMGWIRCDYKMMLVDGNHRSEILYAVYGSDYEVEIKQTSTVGTVFYILFKWIIVGSFMTYLFCLFLINIATMLIKLPFWILGFTLCNLLWYVFGIDMCGRRKEKP